MSSERGNIVVYTLVGLLLFGAMLGTFWWVRKADNKPVVVTGVAKDETSKNKSPETKVNQDEVVTGTPSKGDESAQTAQNTPTVTAPAPTIGTASSTNSDVAATGPTEDRIIVALGLGALIFLGSSYIRSRSLVKAH